MSTKKPTMTAGQKRAHTAEHQTQKEKHRHSEATRKLRTQEKMTSIKVQKLAIDEAGLELRQEEAQRRKQADEEKAARQEQQDSERRSRQQKQDEEDAKDALIKGREKTLKGASSVVKNLTPNDSGNPSSFRVGSLSMSWGMLFLFLLFTFWMTISKAPNHNNDSRLSVIWKALQGKEQIA